MSEFDLSELPYDELVQFFFDRPVPDPPDKFVSFASEASECEWSHPEAAVHFLTQMCRNFAEITGKFTLGQVNQAIWMTIGFDFDIPKFLWEKSVPLADRVECIRSMYMVYADFVAKSEAKMMENCFDMWWDLVADGFWLQSGFFRRLPSSLKSELRVERGEVAKLDVESKMLLDAMFETLERILALPDHRTQQFALHGLGHLHHPKVAALVQGYIDRNRSEIVTNRRMKWTEQCRDGTVM